MNYVVLDLEWNQPVDGIRSEDRELPFEIVEIGAILLNEERKIIGEFTQIVKPTVYHVMNEVTRNLIHLRMKELKQGKTFPDTMKEFFEWCGEDYVFCTWGSLDLVELQRNMKFHGLAPIDDRPFPYLDIQKLFSIAFEDRKIRRSLEYAVAYLGIPVDIPFHRAFSDAYYTAKVMSEIKDPDVFTNYSFDTYHIPQNRADEVSVLFHDYAKYISRGFPDKILAMQDKEVTSTRCYVCKKNARRRINWFSVNGKHFYSVSQCEKHGYMKGKIRLKKSEDGKIFVVKTQKLIKDEEMEAIALKRAVVKEQRKSRRIGKRENSK